MAGGSTAFTVQQHNDKGKIVKVHNGTTMKVTLFSLLVWQLLIAQCWSDEDVEVCDNTLVLVTGLDVQCDSSTCNYGDYASIEVEFDVQEDVADEGIDMYIKFALYSPEENEKLYDAGVKTLCSQYDADNGGCVNQGSYSFTSYVGLDTPEYGYEVDFVPVIKVWISAEENGGSELGGANIGECDNDDYDEEESSGWNISEMTSEQKRLLKELGIVLALIVASCGGAYLLFKVARYYQCSQWYQGCGATDDEETVDDEYSLFEQTPGSAKSVV